MRINRYLPGIILVLTLFSVTPGYGLTEQQERFLKDDVINRVIDENDTMLNRQYYTDYVLGNKPYDLRKLLTDTAYQKLLIAQDTGFEGQMRIDDQVRVPIRNRIQDMADTVWSFEKDVPLPNEYLNDTYLSRVSKFKDDLYDKLGWMSEEEAQRKRSEMIESSASSGQSKSFDQRSEFGWFLIESLIFVNLMWSLYSLVPGILVYWLGSKISYVQENLIGEQGYWLFQAKLIGIILVVLNLILYYNIYWKIFNILL